MAYSHHQSGAGADIVSAKSARIEFEKAMWKAFQSQGFLETD